MMCVRYLKSLALISIFGLLGGCIGEVQDAATPNSQFRDPFSTGFQYEGIVRAQAVAHDKIEIEFEEVFDSSVYNYFLHVNENEPVKLSLESVGQGRIGYKKYTLRDLLPNTQYKLRVSVKSPEGQASTNENIVLVKTFDNKVADFDGVLEVRPVTGRAHNSARISWLPTPMKGAYEPDPFDPKFYEITYIPKTSGLENINVVGAPGRQTLRVQASPSSNPSYEEISSLEPDTAYYFQVRAIHALYYQQEKDNIDEGTPITVDRELNTSWLEYRTAKNDGLYDFDPDSIEVKNSPGQAGLSTVRVFWRPPEGIFEGYRVFYRKFVMGVDGSNPEVDTLTPELMQQYIDTADTGYFEIVSVSDNFVDVSGLEKYEWYQFKVVPCKTVECKVHPANEIDSSRASDMAAIQVRPQLAPFFGINFVKNPDDPASTDKITIEFDPPATSLGYLNKMKVYCLDADGSDYVPLSNAPVTTSVGNCDGLKYNETINFATTKEITVEPVKNINNSSADEATYCFAMAPAIEGVGFEPEEMPREDWVVRCVQPEILAPTIEEFPGVEGACQVSGDSATVEWSQPTGGVYNKFRIFSYRKDNPSDSFSFHQMVANAGVNDGIYTDVTKNANEYSHEFQQLKAGSTYLVGVLALSDGGTTDVSDDVYSEQNLNVVECKIPYPTATFEEWTRIFAIGPRTDGRVPMSAPNDYNPNSTIFEALQSEGLPYEVNVTGDYVNGFQPDDSNYQQAPGNYPSALTSLNTPFDGRTNELGYAASNSGIVSLAWRDVALSFKGADFVAGQDLGVRTQRVHGYKVYRSDDNQQNWQELTEQYGLVQAQDYNYRIRSNEAPISRRMAFFTDYSVNAFSMRDDVERARVYWYKIVPVYDGRELQYGDQGSLNSHALIKVTLPPANMALVHRKMANRNLCGEMNLSIDKNNHYRCDYNGLGSSPKSSPWRVDETVYDLGGDLLVDRNELGCNFTRGSSTSAPESGNSYYNRPGQAPQNFTSETASFTGYATDANGADSWPFRGCTQGHAAGASRGLLSMAEPGSDGESFDSDNLGPDYGASQFDRLMYGDCVYEKSVVHYNRSCGNPATAGRSRINYPGIPSADGFADCTMNSSTSPTFLFGDNGANPGLLDESFIANTTIQAEHLAVIYNRHQSNGEAVSPYGPQGKILETTANSREQSCMINLAAIGQSGGGNPPWISRWVSVNQLRNTKSDNGYESYVDKTVAQTHSDGQLYESGSSYAVTPSSLWNGARFDEDTKIGRIFSSNSAKLPPLKGFSRQEAQKLCGVYQVEVGFGAEEANYMELEAARQKRLLRRQEFIASAAPSEQKSNTEISDIENGAFTNGACVSNNEFNSNGFSLGFANATERALSNEKADNDGAAFLLTGSSWRGGSQNSELCQSRYGIQDLIGNMAEYSGEVLFCDYKLDTLFYGETGVISQSVVLDGYVDSLDPNSYVRRFARDGGYWFWEFAQLVAVGPDGIVDTADDVVSSNPRFWVDRSPVSGYCSLVDTESTRVVDTGSFRDPSGIFKGAYFFDGSLNTDLIWRQNPFDQASIDSMRNGDGLYLNSGPTNLLPKLAEYNDTWALSTKGINNFDELYHRLGHYFNPVVGLPLMCDSTDRDTCGAYASDNRRITTSQLKDPNINDYVPGLDNFPIGNSQIRHYSLGSSQNFDREINMNSAKQNDYRFVRRIILDGDDLTTDLNERQVIDVEIKSAQEMDDDYGPMTSIFVEKEEFNVPRHSRFALKNGGSFDDYINGRYGMRMQRDVPYNSVWEGGSSNTGIRCAVKVNQK